MDELNQANQTKNNLINLFSNNLKELAIKYTKTIAKNDIGGGLNILKNIEMVVRIIRDIQENENLNTILGDISSVWESLDSTDEITRAVGGTKNKEVINVCIPKYNGSADELADIIRRELPKTLSNKLNNSNIKTNNERGIK